MRRVTSFLIVNVGDILIAANQDDWKLFKTVMMQLAVGEVKILPVGEELDFIGQQLSLQKNGSIGLRMAKFVDSLQEIVLSDVYQKQQFTIPDERRMTLRRQVAGSLLWAVQVYFEISHEVTLMGASIKEAVATVEGGDLFQPIQSRSGNFEERKSIIWHHSFDKLSKNSPMEITRSLTLWWGFPTLDLLV